MDYPYISIITPCLNRAGVIGEAIESVLAQDYPHFEHIIIDGGSTDGTLDILHAYPHLKVISEPDEGMYDALNKGLRLARGELINSLNSDDLYEPGILGRVADCFRQQPEVEAIFGDAVVFEPDSAGPVGVIRNHRGHCFDFTAFQTGFQINSCFMTHSLYRELGRYNSRYRIVADLDFLLRMAQRRVRMAHLGAYACRMRVHPGSYTFNRDMAARCRRLSEEVALWHAWLKKKLPRAGRRYCQQQAGNACFALAAWYASQGQWGLGLKWAWSGWRLAPGQMARRTGELVQIRLNR